MQRSQLPILVHAVKEVIVLVPESGHYDAKISAVRSLADICFLHVLILLIRCIIVFVCALVFKWC